MPRSWTRCALVVFALTVSVSLARGAFAVTIHYTYDGRDTTVEHLLDPSCTPANTCARYASIQSPANNFLPFSSLGDLATQVSAYDASGLHGTGTANAEADLITASSSILIEFGTSETSSFSLSGSLSIDPLNSAQFAHVFLCNGDICSNVTPPEDMLVDHRLSVDSGLTSLTFNNSGVLLAGEHTLDVSVFSSATSAVPATFDFVFRVPEPAPAGFVAAGLALLALGRRREIGRGRAA